MPAVAQSSAATHHALPGSGALAPLVAHLLLHKGGVHGRVPNKGSALLEGAVLLACLARGLKALVVVALQAARGQKEQSNHSSLQCPCNAWLSFTVARRGGCTTKCFGPCCICQRNATSTPGTPAEASRADGPTSQVLTPSTGAEQMPATPHFSPGMGWQPSQNFSGSHRMQGFLHTGHCRQGTAMRSVAHARREACMDCQALQAATGDHALHYNFRRFGHQRLPCTPH